MSKDKHMTRRRMMELALVGASGLALNARGREPLQETAAAEDVVSADPRVRDLF